MNEEQTASQKTALLHRTRDALAVRTQMRTAQRGLHSNPVDIDESSHPGLVKLAMATVQPAGNCAHHAMN